MNKHVLSALLFATATAGMCGMEERQKTTLALKDVLRMSKERFHECIYLANRIGETDKLDLPVCALLKDNTFCTICVDHMGEEYFLVDTHYRIPGLIQGKTAQRIYDQVVEYLEKYEQSK